MKKIKILSQNGNKKETMMNNMEEHVTECEFQVNKPNGDIDFVTVYDLPINVAKKFVIMKYPNCEISLLETKKK
jgi:hypothetical protein